jgi:hypothetical protein
MTTPKRVKDQLQTIQKYCTLLRCAIQNADDITSDLLFSCLVSSHPKTIKGISKIKTMAARKIREDLNRKLVNELENNYEHLPQDLGFMEEAAAIALKNTGQHNGRKSDYRLNLLLSRLSAFYIDVTGRKAKITFNNHPNCYEGIFFNFCETFLTLIGREKDIHSNHAFGKRLQRLLSMDKSPIKKT